MTELNRYHRQMLLPGFGEDGQRRLLRARVLIVGCGALGSVICDMLARAGVGHLVIADRDCVELTNLQRQVLFDESDAEAGLPKAEAARRKLASINSQVRVDVIVDDVNHKNIERLAEGCDVLVDGVDNFETRFLINYVSVKHGIPYVYGGAVGTTGMTCVFLPQHAPQSRESQRALPGGSPQRAPDAEIRPALHATGCLRCVFDQPPPPGTEPTCDTAGVLGPVVSIVANHQAAETLKILTGNLDAVCTDIVHVDLWENTHRRFDISSAFARADCVCCGQRRFECLDGKYTSSTTRLCGRGAVQIVPPTKHELNLSVLADRLQAHGDVKANAFMLRADIKDNGRSYELTVFPDGRAFVHGTTDETAAKSVYAKYLGS